MFNFINDVLDFGLKFCEAIQQFGVVKTLVLVVFASLTALVLVTVRHINTDAGHAPRKEASPVISVLFFLMLTDVAVLVAIPNGPKITDNSPSQNGPASPTPEMVPCADGRCGEGGPAIDPHINYEELRPDDIIEAIKTESTTNKSFICTVYKTRGRTASNPVKITILMQPESACQRYFDAETSSVVLQIEDGPRHGRLDVNGRHFLYALAPGFRGSDRLVLLECEIG